MAGCEAAGKELGKLSVCSLVTGKAKRKGNSGVQA